MDALALLTLAAVIVIGFAVLSRRPPPTSNPPNCELVPISDVERHVLMASETRDRRNRELQETFRAQQDERAAAEGKLWRAKQLVDKSGVADAATSILRITWHWPSWSMKDDWRAPLEVEGLGQFKSGGLAWKWKGIEFGLKLTEPNIVVYANGALVLKLDVRHDPWMDEYYQYRHTGVSGVAPGDWMAAFVDFAGVLEIMDAKRRHDWEKQFRVDKAGAIQLPGEVGVGPEAREM